MWHADGRLGVVDVVDLSELLDLDVLGEAREFVEVSTSSSGVTLMVGWLQEEGEEVAIFLKKKLNWVICK